MKCTQDYDVDNHQANKQSSRNVKVKIKNKKNNFDTTQLSWIMFLIQKNKNKKGINFSQKKKRKIGASYIFFWCQKGAQNEKFLEIKHIQGNFV